MAEEFRIEGCHGTIAEQKDEAFYDDRSDASDDEEKGKIKFPARLYGREKELDSLKNLYAELLAGEVDDRDDKVLKSQIVFLSGYSGVGKSALIKEFVKQLRGSKNRPNKTNNNNNDSPIFYGAGKYSEQNSASSPFFAIIEVLKTLANELSEGKDSSDTATEQREKVRESIRQSDLIGPGKEGDLILRATFPVLTPLLDSCVVANEKGANEDLTVHPTMSAIKECTLQLLCAICRALDNPLIIFLDDLQWADEASMDMLNVLLTSSELKNLMFTCAYRSNEVDVEHSFCKLMDNVAKGDESVEKMELFSLSPTSITSFIADSVKKEEDTEMKELSSAVYQTTMGNIFFTKQALEELVRKNILFYDMMCFEWRWVVTKVELANNMSADVVESVLGKIRYLPEEIQELLSLMAYIPNALDVSTLKALMCRDGASYEERQVLDLLQQSSDEGMLLLVNPNWIFAHDRIRQASLKFASEKSGSEETLLHISSVLLAEGSDREWCQYVAVDILNSLPVEKTDCNELVKLNLKVSHLARNSGALGKENVLVHKGLERLKAAGMTWTKDYYELTRQLYDALLVSEYSSGAYDAARVAIDEVVQNAKTPDEKLIAHTHCVMCLMSETSEYGRGAEEGLEILSKYGFDIPQSPTKTVMAKEEMKYKLALRNRSISFLTTLPIQDDSLLALCQQINICAMYSGKLDVMKLLNWKIIQYVLKKGSISSNLAPILGLCALMYVKLDDVKRSNEFATAVQALNLRIRDDKKNYAMAGMCVCLAMCLLQNFRSLTDPFLQSYKDFKLMGEVEMSLNGLNGYAQCFFGAGCELGPIFESKLLVVEDYCRNLGRQSSLILFSMFRQFALNLRKPSDNPSKLVGEAFNEEQVLSELEGSAHFQTLRDSSSLRVQLAFVFWNEADMIDLLKILETYPLQDQFAARLHNRLAFTGLAAFAMCHRKDCASYKALGEKCMSHFKFLSKNGSVNARPVYLFLKSMKSPSRDAFSKAIEACAEGKFVNLEAMVNERYAAFLREENDEAASNDCITEAYFLYQDWGAHAKALQLSKDHSFLKKLKRKKERSVFSSSHKTANSTVSTGSDDATSKKKMTFSFNSTLKQRKLV
uniref:Orc1-like AAA ATPase domain-containing protein n=1 Tax=Skeletonema marinoi TaxID=267567 RepID=A0A7S2LW75_9STRA|mmetsp:Transcript_29464/g.50248  ORF Transcript_29464/g.50248 Transcript_29464/m.50248 type:complete len:1108 (+) Transcript_29464:57-3380(+)